MRSLILSIGIAVLLGFGLQNHAFATTESQLTFGSWTMQIRDQYAARLQQIARDYPDYHLDGASVMPVFDQLTYLPKVIDLDQKQPESKITWQRYKQNVVTQARIDKGRALYQQHYALLQKIGARYGVDPSYIVALWGIETSFGQVTGGFDLINALATLAYDGRRADFFRDELFYALDILAQNHIDRANMKGSWAGAMGQCQFMPSSFFKFAVDYNRDGHTDIWTDKGDVFASAANYLHQSGWKSGQKWGRAVRVPNNIDATLFDLKTAHPLSFWEARGVRLPNGAALPVDPAIQASLIRMNEDSNQSFLVYDNFKTILKWNNSRYFGAAVGMLADHIKSF